MWTAVARRSVRGMLFLSWSLTDTPETPDIPLRGLNLK
jgi:hypothetical protein